MMWYRPKFWPGASGPVSTGLGPSTSGAAPRVGPWSKVSGLVALVGKEAGGGVSSPVAVAIPVTAQWGQRPEEAWISPPQLRQIIVKTRLNSEA